MMTTMMSTWMTTMLKTIMKPIIDEKITWFVYHKGEPIGMWINIPDLNQLNTSKSTLLLNDAQTNQANRRNFFFFYIKLKSR